MRLDKWLKIARVIKRRTVANDICDQGRVVINGRTAKAATTVAPGDRLVLRFGSRVLEVEVLVVPTGQVAASMAKDLYVVIGQTFVPSETVTEMGLGNAPAGYGADDGNEAV